MLQYYRNILTIDAPWLMAHDIMTAGNYQKLAARHDINVVRRGCRNTPALVSYESIPERFQKKMKEVLKVDDVYKIVSKNILYEYIADNAQASEYFEEFRLPDGKFLPFDKRREYYSNTIVLNAIGELINSRNGKRQALGKKACRFWDEISSAVQELDRTRYPHSLPVNPRSLERKYKAYMAGGYETIIHKAFLAEKSNSTKIADENQQSALAVIISDPRNFDNEQCARLYNMLAEHMQWKTISASTVAVWRDKLDNMIYARRHGAVAYRSKKEMQVKRVAPSYPLCFWTIDGWDVELMYQKTTNGKTTYHNRLTVVVVLDACCKYPIGYAIGTHETPSLIREALRNAVKHTERLFGMMYKTAQIQSDRYQYGNLKNLYSQVAVNVTPARAKNAKAKIIEPWFGYFNKKYCQWNVNWSGVGVTSRKDLQPNSDFLNEHRHQFPDFIGLCKQLIAYLESERAELHDKYTGLFNKMPVENRTVMTDENYLMSFGETNFNRSGQIETYMMQGSGINVSIQGIKKSYDCFNPDFRNYSSTRWKIFYDPDNTSHVLAVNDDASLRFLLEEKYVQPMALIERKEGDYNELKRIFDFNKMLEKRIGSALSEHQERVQSLLENKPQLETLQKLMICDSSGQHKNRRNEARLQISEKSVESDVFSVEDLLNDF